MCPLQFFRWRVKSFVQTIGVEAQVYYTKKKCFLRNSFSLAHTTLRMLHICLWNKHNYHQSYILPCSSILWRTILTKIINTAFSYWMCYAYSTLHFGIFDFVRVILISCNNFSGQSQITINRLTNSWKRNV